MLTVSVALAAHNGEAFLAEQVDSILAQTRRPDEIVLSDDASTDDTIRIAEERIAAAGIPLTVLRNDPALGVTQNFQQAALATTGELIAFADQDDVWHPEKLAVAAARFEAEPDLALLHSDAQLVDATLASLGKTLFQSMRFRAWEFERIHAGRAIEALVRRSLVTGATMTIRRSLLETAVPFGDRWVHDEWLAVIAGLTARVDVLERPLIQYRQHGGNQLGAKTLTPATAWHKLTERRGPRNARMLAMWTGLEARLADDEALRDRIEPADLELIAAKAAHERFRSALPRTRLLRMDPILQQSLRGGYRRCGQGVQDMFRDFVQPV